VSRRLRVLAAAALALCAAAGSAAAGWGSDLRDAGPRLLEGVRPRLLAIVRAAGEEREALVAAFVREDAEHAEEAVKRFRNDELRPLFRAMVGHPEWRVAHRALTALERMEDGPAFRLAWGLLGHAEPAMREKAAIACLRLWDAPGAERPADAGARIAAALAKERDLHLRGAFAALARRAKGDLPVERASSEARVRDADGLVSTPLLRGMWTAERVAPDFRPRPTVSYAPEGVEAPVATAWTSPMRDFGVEEQAPGWALQPFGHRRNGGTTVHTGADVGAFRDGCGLYACAAGVVRMVSAGTDTGTLIVIEHRLEGGARATTLLMHAADVVFVRAGDVVEAGTLVGSLGLGYSFENGGHFAHLHLGAYPGPFHPGHNYGYRPAAEPLTDWFDPVPWLAERMSGEPLALPAAASR
jgi:murein DD-endopeptidase MepM/ murein hydrolase activator NlpD